MDKQPQILKNAYTIFCIISYLILPIATIPIGVAFYYITLFSLPSNDIQIIYHGSTPIWTATIASILIAPIYYLFTIFNRSEMRIQEQTLTHVIFCLLNGSFLFYLNYLPTTGLSAFYLAILPQLLGIHILHVLWVHIYRNFTFNKLLSVIRTN